MKLKTRLTILVFLLLALAFTVTPVFAAQEGPEDYTLTSILVWILAGPGAAVLVGLLLTQVLENIPAWHKLPSQLKFVLSMVFAGGLALAAQALLASPFLPTLEPYANTIINAIVVWLASQSQLRSLKGTNYGINPGVA